jgi:hypothetical protein
MPEVQKAGIPLAEFKSAYPLKCKTRVVEVSEDDVMDIEKAQVKIADAMAECWALYGRGDLNVFPSDIFKSSSCVPCARVHLTDDAKDYMEKEGVEINIGDALDLRMDQGFTYRAYLENGDRFSAFNFGNAVPFDLDGDGFSIEGVEWNGAYLPRFWQNVVLRNRMGGDFEAKMGSVGISLPRVVDFSKGDLLINYGVVNIGGELGDSTAAGERGGFGNYVPYLFYFQSEDGKPFDEVKKIFVFNPSSVLLQFIKENPVFTFHPASLAWSYTEGTILEDITESPSEKLKEINEASVSFCGAWEGIPA